MRRYRGLFRLCTVFLMVALLLTNASTEYKASAAEEEENVYYFDKVVNTGLDTGYSKKNSIGKKDPHFSWKIGKFAVRGFTRYVTDEDQNIVFLKNAGDTVSLSFILEQNISKLNGNKNLAICKDKDGYDSYFGIKSSNFGRGTLIIRKTDYQNNTEDPVIYRDYLAANLSKNAEVQVDLFEEGDYEVALNYEIKKTNVNIFGWKPFPSYYNYRIFFKFSVRNGDCMVFPFDVSTGDELTNTALTENGFYLDFAKSRYLDVDIRKEVLNDGANGLVEDTQFNRPAKDGEQYTGEGIYTITAKNRYTGNVTEKVIYVGTNDILKAYVTTGLSIPEIQAEIQQGAYILADGTMMKAEGVPVEEEQPVETTSPTVAPVEEPVQPAADSAEDSDIKSKLGTYGVGAAITACGVGSVAVVGYKIRKKKKYKTLMQRVKELKERSE